MAPLSGAPSSTVALLDHHAHSVARRVPDRRGFERYLTESAHPAPAGCSWFDSFLGAALLCTCSPLLDLPAGAGAAEYLARRAELGDAEASRRLLRGAGVEALLVDDGYRPDELVSLAELAELAGSPVRRIVRLEHLAERLAGEGVRPERFADAFAERLAAELAGREPAPAVACKSVLAYRHGLDVEPAEPGPAEVREAAADWLEASRRSGALRLTHPVLLRHLVWVAVRAGRPLQFHTGYGDADLEIHRSDPALLTRLVRLAEPAGTPIVLLHCYPYHRQAAYLAGVYPNVYFDVGLALNFVGHRAPAVLAEALETAPFHKTLYSSDAFGLAELHHLAAVRFRAALVEVLSPLGADAGRVAGMIGAGNARRLYGLAPPAP